MRAQIDDSVISIGGDGQITETGNPRDRREVDGVLPAGEILDGVVSIACGVDESIRSRAAVDRVVARTARERVVTPPPPRSSRADLEWRRSISGRGTGFCETDRRR